MKYLSTLAIVPALLAGCGGGGSSGDPVTQPADDSTSIEADPNLPSGLPVGTPDPVVTEPEVDTENPDLPSGSPVDNPTSPVVDPSSLDLPENTLDSTTVEWEALRTTPAAIENGCNTLMGGLITNRGLPEDSSEDNANPYTYWYWTQGYVATFTWTASNNCTAADFRFAPQSSGDQGSPVLEPITETPVNIQVPYFEPVEIPDPVVEQEPVVFELLNYGTTSYDKPVAYMEVTNNQSNVDIWNVSCDLYAVQGTLIVDTAFVYFASGATIRGGESALGDGVFFGIDSFDEFDTARSECSWLIR